MADNILRRPRVTDKTGLSRSTLYEAIKRGEFPAQVKLGARSVGWLESDIEAWIAARSKPMVSKGVQP